MCVEVSQIQKILAMGSYISNESYETHAAEEESTRGKKRKRDDENFDDSEADKVQETLLNTPKK